MRFTWVNLASVLKALLDSIAGFILPNMCVNCYQLIESAHALCHDCFKKYEFISNPICDKCGCNYPLAVYSNMICERCAKYPPEYDKCRTIFRFTEFSRRVIYNFKFHDRLGAAKFFVKIFVAKYRHEIENADIITSVPMHKLRRIMRMYNPPEIIAKEILALFPQKRCILDLLIKTRYTKPQRKLMQDERYRNLEGSISFNSAYNISGQVVLLIDDVLTTGATANYCAKILKDHKAAKVIFFSIART